MIEGLGIEMVGVWCGCFYCDLFGDLCVVLGFDLVSFVSGLFFGGGGMLMFLCIEGVEY